MASDTQVTEIDVEGHELEAWIDENSNGPEDVPRLLERLVARTIPPEPWDIANTSHPLNAGFGGLSWPWNRAAGNLVDAGHAAAGLEIWSALYLTYLTLQQRFHHRYHKGMPLCNIGYALMKAGDKRMAAKSWLLGVIEDAVTDLDSSHEKKNFNNLVKIKVPLALLEQLSSTIESRFIDQAITPMLPETAIDLWLHPTNVGPTRDCVELVGRLCQRLANAYPVLPDAASKALQETWQFIDWKAGGMP